MGPGQPPRDTRTSGWSIGEYCDRFWPGWEAAGSDRREQYRRPMGCVQWSRIILLERTFCAGRSGGLKSGRDTVGNCQCRWRQNLERGDGGGIDCFEKGCPDLKCRLQSGWQAPGDGPRGWISNYLGYGDW